MNWFERHLNWTVILAFITALIISFVIFFMINYTLVIAYPRAWDATIVKLLVKSVAIAGIIVTAAIVLPIAGWTLRQKKRSLWWLLLAGWFSPLWLGDKSDQT